MPKQLIPADWIEKPCRFFSPTSAADVCNLCDDLFTFWNGSRHCYFCGSVFHRKQCSSKCSVEGYFFRRRICSNCEYYKGCANQLKEGEEFVCARDGDSNTVAISLCEETAELLLYWKGRNVTETVDLLGVEAKKGYSLRARLCGTGNYDPLKSLTLILSDTLGEQRVLYIKASSAWICQMWVEGLKCARYVYQAMLQQDKALELYTAKGIDVNKRFRTYYLPQDTPGHKGSPTFSSSHTVRKTNFRDSLGSNTISSYSMEYGGNHGLRSQLSFRSGYYSDRSKTPSPTRNHFISHSSLSSGYLSDTGESLTYSRTGIKYMYKRPLSMRVSRPRPVQRRITRSAPLYEKSTPGLPYVRSPLSSICPCHSYEIPIRGQKHTTNSSKCCSQCCRVCPIAQDLDNL